MKVTMGLAAMRAPLMVPKEAATMVVRTVAKFAAATTVEQLRRVGRPD